MNYIVLISLFLFISCSRLFSEVEKNWFSLSSSSGASEAVCSDQCERRCRDVFSHTDDYEECMSLGYSSARKVDSVYSRMRKGNWSSIESEELEVLVDISIAPWLKQAQSHAGVREMLVWIAENEDIAQLLDDEGAVLKEGLESISYKRNEQGIKDGLNVHLEDERRFLEMMAWEENNEGLKKTHQLILDVCENNDRCVENIYCIYKGSDIIFELITDLELHSDFVSEDVFHSGLCS